MKPTPQISSNHRPLKTEGIVRSQSGSLPLTDYSFQATVGATGTTSSAETQVSELRTFRAISREFFQTEAAHDYAIEAVFFAGVACVAAWPIVVVLNQLTGMMI